jgi:hypothetical protein
MSVTSTNFGEFELFVFWEAHTGLDPTQQQKQLLSATGRSLLPTVPPHTLTLGREQVYFPKCSTSLYDGGESLENN